MADITTGLQAWYKFDEGSGTSVLDASGNANTGTENNSPTYVTGTIGPYALSFTGTANVSIPDSSSIGQTGAMTMAFWVKVTDFNNYRAVLTKTGNVNTNVAAPYDFYFNITDGKPQFIRGNGGVASQGNTYNVVAGTTAPSTSIWQHVAVTDDGGAGSTVIHYLNGVANGTGTMTMSQSVADTVAVAYIGTRGDGVTQMLGSIDDVRLYNRALTAADITALYNYTGISGGFFNFM